MLSHTETESSSMLWAVQVITNPAPGAYKTSVVFSLQEKPGILHRVRSTNAPTASRPRSRFHFRSRLRRISAASSLVLHAGQAAAPCAAGCVELSQKCDGLCHQARTPRRTGSAWSFAC